MMKASVPLFGYNSSVVRNGRTFHVQTEDSGVGHPHVITHVFAAGGRIIATHRTSYAEFLGAPDLPVLVRRMLVTQHREAFIALHEGRYDDETAPDEPAFDVGFALAVDDHEDATAANDGSRCDPIAAPPDLVGSCPFGEELDDIILRHLSR